MNVMASLVTYNRLSEIDQGAIEVNKRLGRTLEFIKLVQDKRANNRLKVIQAVMIFRVTQKTAEEDALCSLSCDDMPDGLKILQSRSDEISGKKK
ncbi:hypothetical protein [Klebsiella quasipneumoniae]|uniref:hypothetical protein n=1 Tax=Klebsiella quasipneumoniae TaxID=1463165 RepID=UPI000A421013|nr:hypothetical protein [Klebsiella quasipneumoniae]MDM7180754.1 hypothetical protein [Klebsiella quasipneumoniae subsp. similipneumoniae]MDM7303490.1 hypothetical protein [Klebsiella quasipneumoniae subsp. similipneumoniae]HCA5511946.1 hypothetical protein [Klebsiella variicola]HDK6748174.1 hypothetical protein [Klebsiella variicola]